MARTKAQHEQQTTGVDRKITRRAAALLLSLSSLSLLRAASAAGSFQMIVHPENPTAEVARQFLADAFLKKTTQWTDGQTIQPVDLKPDSVVRARFTDAVLKRSVGAVKHYWQQIIFSGRGIPPPEVESDSAVVDYVLRHRGGVGYVTPGAAIKNAKILSIRE